MTDTITSPRLRELLRMRRFLDAEIREERQRIAYGGQAPVLQAAADLYGTTIEDIRSGDKSKSITNARMVACWMLREIGLSFPEIGQSVGCHHTTAMHACKVIAADPARKALAMGLLEQEAAA